MSPADGTRLKEWREGISLEVPSFLHAAIALTEMVRTAHKQIEMIGDLSPDGILIQQDRKPAVLAENRKQAPAYCSPEQTGRMNGDPDARSDMYTLGIIFYEMLTGCLPFQAQSAEEWMHAHLAIVPKPLRELRPETEGPLENIVMKLLAKPPGERYQSAYGLWSDLRKCAVSLEETGEIIPFEIGRLDDASRFRLPRKLFGREAEAEALREAYDRARAGENGFVFVTGRAGSGKSALIRELQATVAREGGRFVAGKCDLLNRDIPFEPILQAFRRLLQYIWGEPPETVARLKTELTKNLGPGAGVIGELLPEAARLLGDWPPVEPLPPAKAAIRFRRLFPAFLQAFAETDRAIVLFLDDLQWVDLATMDLLHTVANHASLKGLLVIGAYRTGSEPGMEGAEDQAAASSWFDQALSLEGAEPRSVRHLALDPLSYVDVRRLISSVLNENTARVRGLAESLYHRTGGNPLYLHQLLDNLHRENKLYFDEEQSAWAWDAEAIRQIPENPDVVPLIESRLRLLPRETLELLAIAAALGQRCRPAALARIGGRTLSDTLNVLRTVEDEGLISRETDAGEGEEEDSVYTFLHDRVQQAAYDTVPEAERPNLHLKIGRVMLRDVEDRESESVFDTVYHLNLGCSEIEDEDERRELAALNLQAGLKSKATTAFAAGLRYLQTGLLLLGEEDAVPGTLAYRLMLELPECEYMCGHVRQAEERLERLIDRTTDLLERSRIYLIRIKMNAYLKRDEEAVSAGLQALSEFGWKLPAVPSKPQIAKEMALTQWVLHRIGDRRLLELPFNDHPRYRALSDLVMEMSASAFVLISNLPAVLYPRFVRYGLRQGNHEAFAFMLGAYGMIYRFGFPNSRTGFRMMEAARLLSSSFDSAVLKCRLHFVMGLSAQSQSTEEAVAHFEQSVRYGLDSADLTFAGFSMAMRVINHTGDLRTLSERVSEYEQSSRNQLDDITRRALRIAQWHAGALQGDNGELDADLRAVLDHRSTKSHDNQAFYIVSCKMEQAYLAGRYREALEWGEYAAGYDVGQTPLLAWKRHLYHAFSLAALYAEAPMDERKSIRAKLRRLLRAKKSFGLGGNLDKAADGPAYLIATAEGQRIDGNREAAAKSFEQAITAANREGSKLLAAIACERAAAFYREAGIVKAAYALLADAIAAYSEWGAAVKAQELIDKHPELGLSASAMQTSAGKADQPGDGMEGWNAPYEDLNETARKRTSVIEDGKAFLRQIAEWEETRDPQMLMSRFLDFALRYSGAEKGYVLQREREGFVFRAQAGGFHGDTGESASFAEAVARSVILTGDPVVLADAFRSPFASDPYIRGHRPQSILCMPVVFPGMPPAVLYLENNLISGVFTKDRLDVLELMISRMVYKKSLMDSRLPSGGLEDSDPHHTAAVAKASEPPADPLVEPLTSREAEILYALSDGLSNKEIAERFRITEGTVKSHVFRLYGKLGVKRRGQAIARAREMNFIDS